MIASDKNSDIFSYLELLSSQEAALLFRRSTFVDESENITQNSKNVIIAITNTKKANK